MRSRATPLLVLFVATALFAGDPWEEKDYQKWSEKDCDKVLERSPWTDEYILRSNIIEPIGGATAADRAERASNVTPEVVYEAQIRSALPVRQAVVRKAQINAGFDTMTLEQKKSFMERAQAYLAATYPDTILIYVTYRSNIDAYDRELAFYWQEQTLETIRQHIFLSGAERVFPLEFKSGEGGRRTLELVFPRQLDGRPVITPETKSLSLEFRSPGVSGSVQRRAVGQPPPDVGARGGIVLPTEPATITRRTGFDETRIVLKFDPRKMQVGGELVY